MWENLRSDRDPLRLLHRWGTQVTGCGGQRDGRLTLSPRGDRVFVADGRAWLKILHWRTGELCRGAGFTVAGMEFGEFFFFFFLEQRCRNICIIPPSNICPLFTGTVSKLTNHSSLAGVTDCAHQTGGLLISSCYDLANGEHSLNCEWQVAVQSEVTRCPLRGGNHSIFERSFVFPVFALPQCRYLASLTWPGAPRIICFAAWTTRSGDHRWVTGGRSLVVWEQLPSSGKQK